jgi:microcystin-dependent protein
MPKNKVSEWSATASNNTDIAGINIAEGCAPSGINNAIRELMAQVKDMQTGTDADNFTVGGNLTVTGTATGATPSVSDDSTKFATTAFVRDIIPTGVIVMWSGTIATIPSGWFLCDGNNSTPDLRNRFIIGANADDGGAAKTNVTGSATQTGGTKDAIVVSHSHTTDTAGSHQHAIRYTQYGVGSGTGVQFYTPFTQIGTANDGVTAAGGHTHTISTEGSSGTNQNLVPYYALAFIMKS